MTGIRVKDPTTPHQAGLENDPGDASDASDATFRNSVPVNLARTLLETNVTNVTCVTSLDEYNISEWVEGAPWDMKPGEDD